MKKIFNICFLFLIVALLCTSCNFDVKKGSDEKITILLSAGNEQLKVINETMGSLVFNNKISNPSNVKFTYRVTWSASNVGEAPAFVPGCGDFYNGPSTEVILFPGIWDIEVFGFYNNEMVYYGSRELDLTSITRTHVSVEVLVKQISKSDISYTFPGNTVLTALKGKTVTPSDFGTVSFKQGTSGYKNLVFSTETSYTVKVYPYQEGGDYSLVSATDTVSINADTNVNVSLGNHHFEIIPEKAELESISFNSTIYSSSGCSYAYTPSFFDKSYFVDLTSLSDITNWKYDINASRHCQFILTNSDYGFVIGYSDFDYPELAEIVLSKEGTGIYRFKMMTENSKDEGFLYSSVIDGKAQLFLEYFNNSSMQILAFSTMTDAVCTITDFTPFLMTCNGELSTGHGMDFSDGNRSNSAMINGHAWKEDGTCAICGVSRNLTTSTTWHSDYSEKVDVISSEDGKSFVFINSDFADTFTLNQKGKYVSSDGLMIAEIICDEKSSGLGVEISKDKQVVYAKVLAKLDHNHTMHWTKDYSSGSDWLYKDTAVVECSAGTKCGYVDSLKPIRSTKSKLEILATPICIDSTYQIYQYAEYKYSSDTDGKAYKEYKFTSSSDALVMVFNDNSEKIEIAPTEYEDVVSFKYWTSSSDWTTALDLKYVGYEFATDLTTDTDLLTLRLVNGTDFDSKFTLAVDSGLVVKEIWFKNTTPSKEITADEVDLYI